MESMFLLKDGKEASTGMWGPSGDSLNIDVLIQDKVTDASAFVICSSYGVSVEIENLTVENASLPFSGNALVPVIEFDRPLDIELSADDYGAMCVSIDNPPRANEILKSLFKL